MLYGMLVQIFFGIMCGQTKFYELHVLFRCVVAAACSIMCVAGQTISKLMLGQNSFTYTTVDDKQEKKLSFYETKFFSVA